MKKVLVVFMFLMLAGGVLAMADPIRIKAQPGNRITLNVRDAETGVTISKYKDGGIADENGFFETRTYYLLKGEVVYHVMTFSGLELLHEGKFEDRGTEGPFLIDCTGECFMIIDSNRPETEVVVENETIVENETEVGNETIVEEPEINKTETPEENQEGEEAQGFLEGMTGRVTSEVNGKNKPFYLGGFGVFFAGLLFFLIVKRAYRSGAKAELKNLAKIKLDEKIDALDND
jgi:hypothetical protein